MNLKYLYNPQELVLYIIKIVGIQKSLFKEDIRTLNGISMIFADENGISIPIPWKNGFEVSIREDILKDNPIDGLQTLNIDIVNKIHILQRDVKQLEVAKESLQSSLKFMFS